MYQHKIKPTHDIIAFFAFISFFPQLVAGPIERATNLLPQFLQNREFSYEKATDGMRQILWGLFKKMVVADNCAMAVNTIFAEYQTLEGNQLLLGAIFSPSRFMEISQDIPISLSVQPASLALT